MKKTALILTATILLLAGCGGGDAKNYNGLYKHGTVAKYNIFVNDVYCGQATYTFTREQYKNGKDCIKIVRNSETKNKIADIADDIITSISEVWFNEKDYTPYYQKFRTDWSGKTAGWQEIECEYGDKMVKWTNRTPAGSQSKDIKFFETYYDEDEMAWLIPLLGYKEDKKVYFTAFANKSGQPVQGLIWMGSKKNVVSSNVSYDSFAASARLNEIPQNVWFDLNTGRLVKYMQDAGFMGYPINPKSVPEDYTPPKTTYVESLDSWTEPQN